MIKYLLLFIHILIYIFNASYSLIINDKKYDHIYIIFTYLILLHWPLLKGECILSYIFKKIQNKNYILGSNSDYDDYDFVLGKYRNYIVLLVNIIYLFNMYIISKRNNIKKYYYYIFTLLYISYIYGLVYFEDKNFQIFNNIMGIFIILFGIYFYINNKKIFNKDIEEQNI